MQKRWNGRKNGAKEGERTSVRPCFLTPQIASSRGVWKGNTVGKQRGAFIPAQPGTNPGIALKNQGFSYVFQVLNESKKEFLWSSSDSLLYLPFSGMEQGDNGGCARRKYGENQRIVKRPTINFCPTFFLFLDRFFLDGTALQRNVFFVTKGMPWILDFTTNTRILLLSMVY